MFGKYVYDEEYLHDLKLNERQIKAVMHVKEKGQITNKEYQEICKTSKRTASRDLLDLASSGVFEQIGTTGVGTTYILKVPYGAIMVPKAPKHIRSVHCEKCKTQKRQSSAYSKSLKQWMTMGKVRETQKTRTFFGGAHTKDDPGQELWTVSLR